jgi:hypothetical protein
MPDFLENLGITDEDIADREPSDYFLVAPKNQELTAGVDGVFASNDRWNLKSVSADFRDPAIATGSMIKVTFPATGLGNNNRPVVRERVRQFAVEIPDPLDDDVTKLLLRRQGLAAMEGEPPGPIGGATALRFVSLTVQPQIRQSARFLLQKYKTAIAKNAITQDDFENAAITLTLWNLYKAQCRMFGDKVNDDFAAKATAYRTELDAIYANLDDQTGTDDQANGSIVLGILPGRRRYCRYRCGSEA